MPKAILTEQAKGGGSGSLELLSIEITTNPTKTSYLSGETFNDAGMVMTAHWGLSGMELKSGAVTGYTWEPTVVDDTHKTVTFTYSDSTGSATASLTVTVTPIPSSMTITTAPTATQTYLGSVSNTGAVARVTYSDGSTQTKQASALTRTVPSSSTWNAVGNQTMTFTYTENGITVSASTTVTVNKAT